MKNNINNKTKVINKKNNLKEKKLVKKTSNDKENDKFNLSKENFKLKEEPAFLCLISIKNNDRLVKIINKEDITSFLKAKTSFKVKVDNKLETYSISDVIEYSVLQTSNFVKIKK